MTCAYCEQLATHAGEGELVCPVHIHPQARGEYRELEPSEPDYS